MKVGMFFLDQFLELGPANAVFVFLEQFKRRLMYLMRDWFLFFHA